MSTATQSHLGGKPQVRAGLWARQGSNLRPLACKARALPLSYAPRAPRVGARGAAPCRVPPQGCEWRGAGGPSSGGQLTDGVLPAGLLPRVTGLVDLGEGDHALGVDEERAAQRHAGLLVEDAVGLRRGAVRPEVAEQREVEVLLRLE